MVEGEGGIGLALNRDIPPLAVIFHNASLSRQRRHGNPAYEQQDFWFGEFDMLVQERTAHLDFVCRGVTVFRRAPIHDIGDVEIVFRQRDSGEHTIKKLSRPPDKGLALHVLVPARRLGSLAILGLDRFSRLLPEVTLQDGDWVGSWLYKSENEGRCLLKGKPHEVRKNT